MARIIFLFFTILSLNITFGQTNDDLGGEEITIAGQKLKVLITEEGDTIYIASALEDVTVSSPVKFNSKEESDLYRKYRYYAPKVYPYAVKAIQIFRETEAVTANMKNKERKRHIKRLQKELKKEFEDPLKNLTKTQGYILMKMIEKETGSSMHNLIRGMRGRFKAFYWSAFARLYGHKLKRGYHVGDDRILDIVLQDYDISHKVTVTVAQKKEDLPAATSSNNE